MQAFKTYSSILRISTPFSTTWKYTTNVSVTATTKTKTKGKRSDPNYSGSQEQGDILENVDLTQSSNKKSVADVSQSAAGGDNSQAEVLNKKAISIVDRVRAKLTGRDFPTDRPAEESIDVPKQVDLLLKQATSHENLCQCYIGWCPFW